MTTVRSAEPDDFEAVVSLEARVFADSAWSPRSLDEEFAAHGQTRRIVVAVDADRVVGHAVLLAAGDTGDVTRVAVDGDRRRAGIGTRLLDALVDHARRTGLGALLLEVADSNSAAIGLYERHGFTPIDRRVGYYPDGSDAIVMRKDLDGDRSGRDVP
jgi:ribosomal-protein-alanine N-acetyltransferase